MALLSPLLVRLFVESIEQLQDRSINPIGNVLLSVEEAEVLIGWNEFTLEATGERTSDKPLSHAEVTASV